VVVVVVADDGEEERRTKKTKTKTKTTKKTKKTKKRRKRRRKRSARAERAIKKKERMFKVSWAGRDCPHAHGFLKDSQWVCAQLSEYRFSRHSAPPILSSSPRPSSSRASCPFRGDIRLLREPAPVGPSAPCPSATAGLTVLALPGQRLRAPSIFQDRPEPRFREGRRWNASSKRAELARRETESPIMASTEHNARRAVDNFGCGRSRTRGDELCSNDPTIQRSNDQTILRVLLLIRIFIDKNIATVFFFLIDYSPPPPSLA
jgi:hypothetical protein